jgi:predicted anti-sigma-YlaC factor YlaD
MQCDTVRDALSALLDGEDPGLDPLLVDRHVSGCPTCAAHADELATLHRMVRVRAAEVVPDLAATILAAHPPAAGSPAGGTGAPRRSELVSTARWALWVVGLTQLVLAAPSLLLLGADDAALHATRELGAFDVALAVGFIVAAWQPARAWGLLPVAAALSVVMMGTAVLDVVGGNATSSGEAHHVLDLVGVLVLWRVARQEGVPARRTLAQPAR